LKESWYDPSFTIVRITLHNDEYVFIVLTKLELNFYARSLRKYENIGIEKRERRQKNVFK